ncbi:MAG TPA: energy transducer TonB [Bryobacteraceae bacterium]|nr:energy transducer TonB [Bryobacteraceae bacterium]
MPFSFTLELAVVGVLLLLPLIYGQRLPLLPVTKVEVYLPPKPADPPPLQPHHQFVPAPHQFIGHTLIAPSRIPPHPVILEGEPEIPGGAIVSSGPPTGTSGFGVASLFSSKGMLPPAPEPPKAPTVATPAAPHHPVRVSAGVEEAKRIAFVMPVYPAIARTARIQGTVELLGVISKDGTIESLRVVSGHPMLVQAALDAVRQWRYRPTTLNGEPVEVIAPITVNFTLQ